MPDTGYGYLTNKELAERMRGILVDDVIEEAATRLEQVPRAFSLNDASHLADLIRGVQAGAKLRYYQYGTRDADHPLIATMQSFTHDGGGFIREDDDVCNAYVWCSAFSEHWLKVSDLITALDNMQGKHGLDNPMAVIEYKE